MPIHRGAEHQVVMPNVSCYDEVLIIINVHLVWKQPVVHAVVVEYLFMSFANAQLVGLLALIIVDACGTDHDNDQRCQNQHLVNTHHVGIYISPKFNHLGFWGFGVLGFWWRGWGKKRHFNCACWIFLFLCGAK